MELKDEIIDIINKEEIDGEILATSSIAELKEFGLSAAIAKKLLNRVPKE